MIRRCKRIAELLQGPWESAALAVVLVLAAAGSWIAAGFLPFTWPMRVGVLVPVVFAGAYLWWAPTTPRGERAAPTSAYRRGVNLWLALLVAATAWELIALFSSPRDEHPTLSSMSDTIMSTHPGRALTFAVWLAVGWLLFIRPVAERDR